MALARMRILERLRGCRLGRRRTVWMLVSRCRSYRCPTPSIIIVDDSENPSGADLLTDGSRSC